jgi:hypothetical protein
MEGRRCKICLTNKMGRGGSSLVYNYRRQNCRSSNKQTLNQMGNYDVEAQSEVKGIKN